MKYLVAVVVLLGIPLLGSAQTPVPTVVINEVMWMGSTAGQDDEWIELRNTTDEEIGIGGWVIENAARSRASLEIPVGMAIPANGFFLLANYSLDNFSSALNVSVEWVTTSLSLSNDDNGNLVLKTGVEGVVIDQVQGESEWPTGEKSPLKKSMERSDDPGDGLLGDSWHQCDDEGCNDMVFWDMDDGDDGDNYGTPGGPNSAPSATATPEATVPPEEEEGDEGEGEEYSDAIVINEFLPNPVGADAEGEFIELKNMGDVEVNLKDWRLDDGESGSSAYVISEGILIGGGEIMVFLRPETKIALNNGGDEARLFSPDGEIKDEHSYEESVSEGVARARDEEGAWQWSETATPGEENAITWSEGGEDESEEEKEYSDAIVINEFLPNPAGSDTEAEFIELRNIGDEEIDLEGWELDDGEGGSGKYDVEAGERLAAGGLKVFWRSETKIALNNGGDEVRLFSPNGEEKSSFAYEESVGEDVSYNRMDDGDYVLSTTATPGEKNIITELVEGERGETGKVAGATAVKVLLKDVRSQALGVVVEVEGVVSAPPGVFGDKIMYLAGSGIQIYFYREEYPELEVGDKVKVKGELAKSLGEYRIKMASASDVVVMGEEVAPEPHKVTTGEVGESLEGTLVLVAGRVSRTSGDTFYINDGSGEVKVFIKRSTGIDKPKMKKGVGVTIMGVVSRTNAGYRILPRWQGDVRLGLVAGLINFPGAGWLYPSFGGAGLVAVLMLVLAYRAKEPLFNT